MKIFLIDDHTLFRKSLVSMLNTYHDIQVIGDTSNGYEGIAKVKELEPDIVIIDISLQGISGFDVAKAISENSALTKIIFLTASENEDDVVQASILGAKGYFIKNINPDYFINSLRDINNGGNRISPDIAGNIFYKLKDGKVNFHNKSILQSNLLSERELEVLGKLRDGSNNKEIARSLFISENTVKNHLKSIFSKLGVENRTQAVAKAAEQHLIFTRTDD
jgi:two-component system response regulator DegU